MRLTKTQVKTAHTKVLNFRYCRLLEKGEKQPKKISIGEAREILWIEDELRMRVVCAAGRDFYPPDRIEKQYPSNYMVSLLKRGKLKPTTGAKVKFKIAIISSIGSKAAELNVSVNSKPEADELALAEIHKLGLKRATYKIS